MNSTNSSNGLSTIEAVVIGAAVGYVYSVRQRRLQAMLGRPVYKQRAARVHIGWGTGLGVLSFILIVCGLTSAGHAQLIPCVGLGLPIGLFGLLLIKRGRATLAHPPDYSAETMAARATGYPCNRGRLAGTCFIKTVVVDESTWHRDGYHALANGFATLSNGDVYHVVLVTDGEDIGWRGIKQAASRDGQS